MEVKSPSSEVQMQSDKKHTQFVSHNNVKIYEGFFGKYQSLINDVVIPYQWDALNDRIDGAEPSHAIKNFRIAAGLEQGEFQGFVFQDSDFYKWLEAVGYSLSINPEPELKKIADDIIELISKAQQQDGYLNTYFTVKEPNKRWSNLRDCHELYCAGHLIEAAVAYHNATGNTKILDVVCRLADHIDSTFGQEQGKKRGYPGHEEIELALVKLYRLTGEQRYLVLSKFFIDERGKKPLYFELEAQSRGNADHFDIWNHLGASYFQSHLPVREQNEAVGHAVRAVYLYSGMADVAFETSDKGLFEACRTLWDNITHRQMYVTGAIGSMSFGEAFSFDYDLPNDTVYAETCAAIGLVFFAQRMLQWETDRVYSDVMELALYNTVLSGISLDGKKFFYVNPLEVWPEACQKNRTRSHVKVSRQPWFGCACCPPNIARLLMSLGSYIYSTKDNDINIHLYVNSRSVIPLNDNTVYISQKTDYPWDGSITIEVTPERETVFALNMRIPGWCKNAQITINGKTYNGDQMHPSGYIKIERVWKKGDTVGLTLDMPVMRIKAHPSVRENIGKVALKRGPLVYCAEEADNGVNLHNIILPKESNFEGHFENEFLGGAYIIKSNVKRIDSKSWTDGLYATDTETVTIPATIKLIPYYLWANREPGEMIVWMREE
jgi:DUF1680 family protein